MASMRHVYEIEVEARSLIKIGRHWVNPLHVVRVKESAVDGRRWIVMVDGATIEVVPPTDVDKLKRADP